MISRFISYFLLIGVKLTSALFYRYEVNWLNNGNNPICWDDIRLVVFLNHTSLFEPIFIRLAPNSFIWQISKYLVIPGADITLNRPVLGRFFKSLIPGAVSISRKKDFTWLKFLSGIQPKSIVAILPEGRMKRADGLDKHGQQMSVRGGIADILQGLNRGKALFVYSGGLHHIQIPGQNLPKLFKKVKVNLEMVNIEQYKKSMQKSNFTEFKKKLIEDLNYRLEHFIPKS